MPDSLSLYPCADTMIKQKMTRRNALSLLRGIGAAYLSILVLLLSDAPQAVTGQMTWTNPYQNNPSIISGRCFSGRVMNANTNISYYAGGYNPESGLADSTIYVYLQGYANIKEFPDAMPAPLYAHAIGIVPTVYASNPQTMFVFGGLFSNGSISDQLINVTLLPNNYTSTAKATSTGLYQAYGAYATFIYKGRQTMAVFGGYSNPDLRVPGNSLRYIDLLLGNITNIATTGAQLPVASGPAMFNITSPFDGTETLLIIAQGIESQINGCNYNCFWLVSQDLEVTQFTSAVQGPIGLINMGYGNNLRVDENNGYPVAMLFGGGNPFTGQFSSSTYYIDISPTSI